MPRVAGGPGRGPTTTLGDAENTFTVALDEIGVLARDGVTDSQIQHLGSNLTILRHPAARIYFLGLQWAKTEAELTLLIKDLKQHNPGLLKQAGFSVTLNGAFEPTILTDEFIAQFKPGVSAADIARFNDHNGVLVVERSSLLPRQFLLAVISGSPRDAVETAARYRASSLVEYAHPNLVVAPELRSPTYTDPHYTCQWNLDNTGQNAGTSDADVDAPEAWGIVDGDPSIVIAIIDDGMDPNVADLPSAFSGWDFVDNNADAWPVDPTENHGTAMAGVAAAIGDNERGVRGGCPHCRLMPIRADHTLWDYVKAFQHAQQTGADIIVFARYLSGVSSQNYPTGNEAAINDAATNGRSGTGCVVVFGMSNSPEDRCSPTDPNRDFSSLDKVIAVTSSTHNDTLLGAGFGDCTDLLAPTTDGTLLLNVVTTDRAGDAGYNRAQPTGSCNGIEPTPPACCPSSCTDPNAPTSCLTSCTSLATAQLCDQRQYTCCFSGSSAGAPLVGGIAGLVLAADPNLTRDQVQTLLQDTADRIDDKNGKYQERNGFSSLHTHGYGRVNAFEAVRVAAPLAAKGRGGVDVFVRDNGLDWGNTERPSNTRFDSPRGFIPHWESVDIKVDAPSGSPPQYRAPPADSSGFEQFADENPLASSLNKVYVRVRNRGPAIAGSVKVKAYWAFAGLALPALPSDFWTRFTQGLDSTNQTKWHPLAVSTSPSTTTATISSLGYSGSSAAATSLDKAQIVSFDFAAPALDPNQMNPRHYCLLVMLDSAPEDPVSPAWSLTGILDPDTITPKDNNVTHKNVVLLGPLASGIPISETFYARNPYDTAIQSALVLDRPAGRQVELEGLPLDQPFRLEPGQEVLVRINLGTIDQWAEETLTIIQERRDPSPGGSTVMGGITFRAPARRVPGSEVN